MGATVAQVFESCKYEPWFLRQIEEIVQTEAKIRARGLPKDAANLKRLKAMGFSDKRLGELVGLSEDKVRSHRHKLAVRPVYKRIDTCAAEFASPTAYMYSTYDAENEARPSDRQKVIILGGGPNRIGQGIEFDYCCCHACFALHDAGYESIMVNCNPETVSTDYDTSDRLYFEPLTAEDVLEIIHTEQSNGTLKGVIVQFGGQTPLKLAGALEKAGVPILGTTPDAIDLAEDRDRFSKLLQETETAPARERHRLFRRRSEEDRQAHRLPRGDPAFLCAGRPGHGDRQGRRPARALHHRGGGGLGRQPGADRQLSLQCHRG